MPKYITQETRAEMPPRGPGKLNRLVKEVVAEVFNDLQEDADAEYNLKRWAMKNPKDFYLIAAKLIPAQLQHSGEIQAVHQLIFNQAPNCEPINSPGEQEPQ